MATKLEDLTEEQKAVLVRWIEGQISCGLCKTDLGARIQVLEACEKNGTMFFEESEKLLSAHVKVCPALADPAKYGF
jgi:hypothetical protein